IRRFRGGDVQGPVGSGRRRGRGHGRSRHARSPVVCPVRCRRGAVPGGAGFFFGGGGRSRALRWARRNPWRFALARGAACAIVVFVLTVVLGGGVLGGAFTAAWHGAAAFGLTGLAGTVAGGRRRTSWR